MEVNKKQLSACYGLLCLTRENQGESDNLSPFRKLQVQLVGCISQNLSPAGYTSGNFGSKRSKLQLM